MSFFCFTGYSQSLISKIHSKNLFFIEINDSTVSRLRSDQIIGYNYEFYSSHFTYKLPNKNQVSLNVYPDSLMYYEEKDSSDHILFSGTLRFDTSAIFIIPNSNPVISMDGEELFINDTSFTWIQHGIWTERIDGIKKISSYNRGNKTEEHVEITLACQELIQVKVPENKYEINSESGKYSFSPPSKEELKNLVIGEWYHPKCFSHSFGSNFLWIFLKEKPSFTEDNGTTYSTFKTNNQYEAKRSFRCGTGRTKDDYNPKDEWKISESGKLLIGQHLYEILYIDENTMILR